MQKQNWGESAHQLASKLKYLEPLHFSLKKHRISAIYFIIEYGRIIYIGQTCDLHGRIRTHSKWAKRTSVRFIPVNCGQKKRLLIESALIMKFKPSLNDMKLAGRVYKNKMGTFLTTSKGVMSESQLNLALKKHRVQMDCKTALDFVIP